MLFTAQKAAMHGQVYNCKPLESFLSTLRLISNQDVLSGRAVGMEDMNQAFSATTPPDSKDPNAPWYHLNANGTGWPPVHQCSAPDSPPLCCSRHNRNYVWPNLMSRCC